jgi:hemerythrin-like domain-containing protein
MNGTADEWGGRRNFLRRTGMVITGVALMLPFGELVRAGHKAKSEETEEEKVFPPEDLMREHGVLRRILLIYTNVQERLNTGEEFAPDALSSAAGIIQNFIEDYHEKLEERHLFPRFEKAGILVDLVLVLKEQHKAGRVLTEYIKHASVPATLKEPIKRKELARKLGMFMRMYRPHAAREDTVLFPALRSVVSAGEFDSMGEEFEDREQALFGVGGFERIVGQVADLEKRLGLFDLAQFTPVER